MKLQEKGRKCPAKHHFAYKNNNIILVKKAF